MNKYIINKYINTTKKGLKPRQGRAYSLIKTEPNFSCFIFYYYYYMFFWSPHVCYKHRIYNNANF